MVETHGVVVHLECFLQQFLQIIFLLFVEKSSDLANKARAYSRFFVHSVAIVGIALRTGGRRSQAARSAWRELPEPVLTGNRRELTAQMRELLRLRYMLVRARRREALRARVITRAAVGDVPIMDVRNRDGAPLRGLGRDRRNGRGSEHFGSVDGTTLLNKHGVGLFSRLLYTL